MTQLADRITELLEENKRLSDRLSEETSKREKVEELRGEEYEAHAKLRTKYENLETRYYEQQANHTESNGMLASERDALKRRLEAMLPLFQEARDALTAIPLASAKVHNIDLSLGDRMDDVGVPSRWAARDKGPK